MPHETPHRHETADLDRTDRIERESDAPADSAPAERVETPGTSTAHEALPRFSLLADPATISGESPGRSPDDDREDEVVRLREALHARSREVAALARRQAPPRPSDALSSVSAPSTPADDGSAEPREGLLNASEARRLAEEAQARERASRLALATAREALRRPTAETAGVPDATRGWQRRALTGLVAPESQAHPDPDGTTPTAPAQREPAEDPRPGSDPDRAPDELAGVRAELRALRSQLEMALETSRLQEGEIAELRARLSEAAPDRVPAPEAAPVDPARPAPGPSLPDPLDASRSAGIELARRIEVLEAERRRLEERLALNEREIDARDAERALLRRTLEERESEIARHRTRIEALQDRLEVQGQALENTRCQLDRERRLNTKSQELLSHLREVLGDTRVPDVVSDLRTGSRADPALDRENDARAEAALLDPTLSPLPFEDEPLPSPLVGLDAEPGECWNGSREAGTRTDQPARVDRIASDSRRNRKKLFDAWQDDQIRRHFGPMGIDSLADLLRASLSRRAARDPSEQRIVLLGRDAMTGFRSLADGLVQNGSPDFVLFVGDPLAPNDPASGRLPEDSPFRDLVETLDAPRQPADLARLLSKIDPTVVILCDFLSAHEEIDPWLDVLEGFSERGGCLLLAESTGVGPIEAPDEVADVGDRIWELMPERYTRIEAGQTARVASWREAFERLPESPANGLLPRLRRRFRLDMLAQFGFLAEPFLGPIAANFDADAPRDRRFLGQIGDLDDRKIEAGLVPPLHLVALVDSLSED
ncbi:MAG TPA: hypothetical protein ENI85_02225 [Deltaproteobacteria bacterium]|nr:hypothetical protein [Deltaproteobacteria bacterium]